MLKRLKKHELYSLVDGADLICSAQLAVLLAVFCA